MMFPDVERVVYSRNPLAEVVCQLKFPRIFALDTTAPSEFQQALGSAYPIVEIRNKFQIVIKDGQPSPGPIQSQLIYEFATKDKKFVISLCSDYVAVRTTKYERWDYFLPHVMNSVSALVRCYPVPLFTRVGLRYVNFIDRKELQLPNAEWGELISEHLLGLLSMRLSDGSKVESTSASTLITNGENRLALNTGINVGEGSDDPRFYIDADFYCENPTEGEDDVHARLTRYNKAARNVFRWSISDKLFNALGPIPHPRPTTK